jgi:hypothetical protein
MDAPRRWIRLSFLSLTLLAPPALLGSDIPAAEAFGTIPEISDVELSPDGKLLAWHQVQAQRSFAVIFDLETRRMRKALPVEEAVKLRGLTWADNETLLVTASAFATYGSTNAAQLTTTRSFARTRQMRTVMPSRECC